MNVTYSYTRCRFGVATRDVTPPVGIYARSWGAATHEVAEGIHRPFAATAAVFAPIAGDESPLALVAGDLGCVPQLTGEPGRRLAPRCADRLTAQIGPATLEARAAVASAGVADGTGRCALAAHRALWAAEARRLAAGYTPSAPAGDTLVVASVTG